MLVAGFIIQDKDGYAIHGYGATADEAWRMVKDGAGPFFDAEGNRKPDDLARAEDFITYGATAALLDRVQDRGGAIAWDIVEGVACTPEESEAATA